MTDEEWENVQQGLIDMGQAMVEYQASVYLAVRKWFYAIGIDPAELDASSSGDDELPSDPPVATDDGRTDGFRTEPPWSQNPGQWSGGGDVPEPEGPGENPDRPVYTGDV